MAKNLTSSVNFSRVASLSWPGGVGAITSARMGRRVGVRGMIVELDSWSIWESVSALFELDVVWSEMGEKASGVGGGLTKLHDHVIDGHVLVEVIFQWKDV